LLIQVDVDSTLYDADRLFAELADEAGIKWPRNAKCWLPAELVFKHDGTACNRDDLVKVFRKAHSKEYVSQQKPYPHAAKVLSSLVDTYDDVEIAYVSDRNEQQTGALREWLEASGFIHNEDTFVAATKDKRHWMRERKPEIVIDDRVRTMLMARNELNAYVVSLTHSWNINLKGEVEHIWLVENWNEISEVLTDELIPRVQQKMVSRDKELAY